MTVDRELVKRAQAAAKELRKKTEAALDRGFDTEDETAEAESVLNTLDSYEHEIRWNHEQEVEDFAAWLNVS